MHSSRFLLVAVMVSSAVAVQEEVRALRNPQAVLNPHTGSDPRFASRLQEKLSAKEYPMFSAVATKGPSGGPGKWQTRELTVRVVPVGEEADQDLPGAVQLSWAAIGTGGADVKNMGHLTGYPTMCNKECGKRKNCFCVPMRYPNNLLYKTGSMPLSFVTPEAAAAFKVKLEALYQLVADGTRDARWHAAAFGTGVAGPAYTCLMQHWTIPAMVDDGFAAYVAAHIMSGEIATDAPTFRGFKLVTPPNRCTVGFVKMEEYLSGKQAKSAKDLSAGDFHGLCKLWHTYYIHELHKVTGGSSLDDPAPTSKPWCPGNLQEGGYGTTKIPSTGTADDFCADAKKVATYVERVLAGSAEEHLHARYGDTSIGPLSKSTQPGNGEAAGGYPFTTCFVGSGSSLPVNPDEAPASGHAEQGLPEAEDEE